MRGIGGNKRVVTLETTVSSTLLSAGATQRGPKKASLRANGLFDIVVGQGNERPRAVIEVKSPLVDSKPNRGVLKDFDRLVSTLKHGHTKSNISCAIFAFYADLGQPMRSDATAKSKILRKFGLNQEFHDHINFYADEHSVHTDYYVSKIQDEGEDGARIWGCVVFTRLKKLPTKQT